MLIWGCVKLVVDVLSQEVKKRIEHIIAVDIPNIFIAPPYVLSVDAQIDMAGYRTGCLFIVTSQAILGTLCWYLKGFETINHLSCVVVIMPMIEINKIPWYEAFFSI